MSGFPHTIADGIDARLRPFADVIGADFAAYRNHACRVAHLCAVQSGPTSHLEAIIAAAAYHDIGIWTAQTFDYIEPSVVVARASLLADGHAPIADAVALMITEHHKLTAYRGEGGSAIEHFRRADLIDLSMGWIRFGVAGATLKTLFAEWPAFGFRRRLIALSLQRLRSHPFSPLPMMKL